MIYFADRRATPRDRRRNFEQWWWVHFRFAPSTRTVAVEEYNVPLEDDQCAS